MKTIRLTKGLEAIVDDEDFEKLNQFKWHSLIAQSNKRYAKNHSAGLMHRYILKADTRMEVDHINGNTLDNRKSNLRLCTHNQNMMNKRRYKNNQSGFKGVYFDKSGTKVKRWTAKITVGGKKITLGRYSSPEEAHLRYLDASDQYFKDFAERRYA